MNVNMDISKISEISKSIVKGIESSKNQIADIVSNIRSEVDLHRKNLTDIKNEMNLNISQQDTCELQSKVAKSKLSEVSSNLNRYKEKDIKDAYDKAYELLMQLNMLRNAEKNLRDRRDQIELSLIKALKNIDNAEKVMTQINVVLGYLNGEILATIEGMDQQAEFVMGIRILEAQENERKRISRDIHDGPAQSIANIVMQADLCEQIMKQDVARGLGELLALKESVRSALTDVRGIIFDLRPMILDDLGLNKTIEAICNKFTEASKIPIQKNLKPEPAHVDPIIQVAAMRMIQEILNNIKKHAHASAVTINVDFGIKYMLITISDDGLGFSVDTVLAKVKQSGESYGLIGLMDRVKQLQGTINLNSKQGLGTAYSIKLPLNKEVMTHGQA